MPDANKEIQALSDKLLVDKFQETGDTAVLLELYNRYIGLIKGVCCNYFKFQKLEDHCQGIFLDLALKVPKYKIDNFRSWLHTVVCNYCKTELGKRKRAAIGDYDLELAEKKVKKFMEFDGLDGLTVLLKKEKEYEKSKQYQKLENCIKVLSVEQERCIKLFYFEDYCYKEIIQMTGFDYIKVRSCMENGRRNLYNCLNSVSR